MKQKSSKTPKIGGQNKGKNNKPISIWSHVIKASLAILGIIAIICFISMIAIRTFERPFDETSKLEIECTIENDDTTEEIANKLADAGIIKDPYYFMISTIVNGYEDKFESGTYVLSPSMSMGEILEILDLGESFNE